MGVLFNPDDRANVLVLKGLQSAAPTMGLTLIPFEVRSPGDFENVFKAMTRERVHAMFGASGAITRTHSGVLVELASKTRVPALYGSSDFVQAGGLLSYGVDFGDQSRRAATYVDKILQGAKPGDLPVEQPTKFELVINCDRQGPRPHDPAVGARAGGRGHPVDGSARLPCWHRGRARRAALRRGAGREGAADRCSRRGHA